MEHEGSQEDGNYIHEIIILVDLVGKDQENRMTRESSKVACKYGTCTYERLA